MTPQDTLLREREPLPDPPPNPPAQPPPDPPRRRWWIPVVVVVGLLIIAGFTALLRYGGYALVQTDPLPKHADVAIVLDGGDVGLRARTAEGVHLLQQGVVGRVMLSLPPKSYWGKSVPQEASSYFRKRFGRRIVSQMAFCISNGDSTIEEASALRWCLETAGWRHVILVTSNYHTRRAGDIWRSALHGAHPPFQLWIDGVQDGTFNPSDWWRNRKYVKTWIFEATKLGWESIFGDGPWKQQPVTAELFNPASSRRPVARTPAPGT